MYQPTIAPSIPLGSEKISSFFGEDYLIGLYKRMNMSSVVVPSQLQDREVCWFRELLSEESFAFDQISFDNADCVNNNRQLEFNYFASDELSSFQIVLPVKESRIANGFGVKVEIGDWKQLSYVALGFRDEKKYHHVKVVNPRQQHVFNFCVGFNDLAWSWSNDWDNPEARHIREIRFYIKGMPGANAYCKISNAWIWQESTLSKLIWQEHNQISDELFSGLNNYQQNYFPDFGKQVHEFMENGTCPLAGNTQLAWPENKQIPPMLHTIGTWQYSWHALHPATLLMLNAQKNQHLPSLMAARDFVTQWMSNSFDRPDPNKKYAWYDHGVAERLLSLVMLYALGQKHKFDTRYMNRLAYTIYRHAQLLASEVFYACHQPTRYHNHAWFQDLALMVVATAFPKWYCSAPWAKLALIRLQDQFEKLMVEEESYAVFTENSFGYHLGVERLVASIAYFSGLLNLSNNIAKISKGLAAFSDLLLYPGNTNGPAQGDTFRLANPATKDKKQIEYWSNERVFLQKSGYFVAKGGEPMQAPWLLVFLATNLNATHKHEDDLSLVFWMDGIEWLIDPSFYSHDYTDELPFFLRSAQAHNMLHIPGVVYNYRPYAGRSELKTVQLTPQQSIVEGINHSCEHYAIYRRIVLSETQTGLPRIEVSDRFEPLELNSQPENGLLCFHFGDGVVIQALPSEQGLSYLLSHPASNKKLILKVQLVPEVNPEIEILPSWSGLGFLEKIETQRLQINLPANAECKWSLYVA